MSESRKTIVIRANVQMTTASLQAIVENAKRLVGQHEKGVYSVDTADKVSEMSSPCLLENDFEGFARNMDYYRS